MFKNYPKILHEDNKNCDFDWNQEVWLSEKIDGTNVQIARKNNKLFLGKRSCNIELTTEGQFIEFCKWAKENYNQLIEIIPNNHIIFGECTKGQRIGKTERFKSIGKIDYDIKSPFILFDVYNFEKKKWLTPDDYREIAKKMLLIEGHFIEHKKVNKDQFEEIKKNLDNKKSQFGNKISEGIVLKTHNPRTTLKVVRKKFNEVHKRPKNHNELREIAETVISKNRIDKIKREIEYQGIKDFGKLMGLIIKDALEEEESYIDEQLLKIYKKKFHQECVKIIKENEMSNMQ